MSPRPTPNMKTLRFVAIIHIALTAGQLVFGATLASQVDARQSGGTASGTFVNNELPPFLLAALGGTYGIRNSAPAGAPQWQFALDETGNAKLMPTTTISLDSITSFSSAHAKIDPADITYSADRFNPTDARYLIASSEGKYYALEVAKWSNNGQTGTNGDRLRFYGAKDATFRIEVNAVPEPSSFIMLSMAALSLVARRKR